jgi:hypothetical protein
MKLIERLARKSAQQPKPAEPGQAPLLMALEPRIMFDASVGVVVQDAAAQTNADAAKDSSSSNEAAKTQSYAATADTGSKPASQRQELVFVDGQVNDTAQLLAGLTGNAEVVILDPTKDGLQQMADYLKGREGLDAIHLLSHGADGTVQMGNVWLASNNLAEHREVLVSIGAALKADGDLMLYGCKVGEGAKGQAFIDQLAAITGADVAASTDDTGAAALGGNWTLERSSGVIETAALSVSGYDSLMVQNYSGGINGTAPVLSSAGNLQRAIVGDFNNDGRADILWQGAGTGGAWSLSLGNANGSFTLVNQGSSPFAGVTLLDAGTNGVNYHAADFDGDGDTDLVAFATTGGQVELYRNYGGSFTAEDITGGFGATAGVRSVAGDFNADGSVDLLYQTDSAVGAPWRVKLNNGNGTFTDVSSTDNLSPFRNVSLQDFVAYNYKVADFDGDGDSDLMYVIQTQQIVYLRNNNGVFETVPGNLGLPITAVNRVVVADYDGDGDVDVLYQTGGNGTAWRYARNDGASFTDMDIASSPFAGVFLADMTNLQYRVGDFDGDGDLDIFVSSASTSSVYFQGGSSPKLASATPEDNSLNVSPTANIVLTFDQSVTKGTGNIYIVRTSDNTVVQTIAVGSGSVTGSDTGSEWTIDLPADLAQGVAYAIRIDNKTFVNTDGKVYAGIKNNFAFNFTTSSVQPPVIANLNGDAVTYVEGSAYVLLDGSSNAEVTDADSSNFNGGKLTAQITTGRVNGEDVLFIRNQGAGANQIAISSAQILYNGLVIGTFTGGSNGDPLVISFTANANATTVAALVQNLAYRNSTTTEPSTTPRSVSISMDDGAGGSSSLSVVALTVQSVNDSPVVTVTATNPTYTENTSAVQLFNGATVNTVESGQKITEMTFTVTTVFNGAAEKLVIDGSDVTLVNGTNVVTTNNGTVVTVSVTSGTASVTLTSSSGLDSATAQSILNTMAYRNDSESPNVSNRVVTLSSLTDNGGEANGGLPTASIGIFSTVAVVGVNDAPVLAGAPYSLPSTNEETPSAGVRVSTLLTNYTMVDADTGALRGIAVHSKSGNGTWQYSTDNVNWTNFGAVSSSSALLLASTTYLRYDPNRANGETASLNFRGWDQYSGTASLNGVPSFYDTTSNGGTTAFSTATAVVNQVVTSLNDAPVLTSASPILPGLSDGQTNNAGVLVSSLYSTNYTDVDTVAVKGIAITGLNRGNGNWQFSTDGGTSWSNVGIVTVNSALLLRSTDRVRFVPDGLNGTTADFTFRAWDQTGISIGLQGIKYDTSVAGGSTAFSSGQDTASITVTALNDAPTLTGSGGNLTWTEGNNTTSIPVVIDNAVTISDADGPYIASATVHILYNYSNGNDYLQLVSNPATMGNIIGTWDAANGTLTLTSAGNQASLAQFQAALRAVTFTNLSDSPTPLTRTVQFQVNDGSLDSAVVTRDIIITGVDDAPLISAPASTQVLEDIATVINQISISDPDSVNIYMTLNVTSGTLSATSGAGVVVGGSSSAMNLSGTIAAVNAFIANNRLTYTTAANATADATLTVLAETGSAGTDTKTITLSVVPVNDAPVVTVPVSIAVTEDLAASVTGISFSDIDAGSASVTATFSVTGGTLSALSGNGVTVTDSGTATLTLSGSLSDINAFIAAASVKYQTALDSTASVLLSVTINDNGNTGGSALTDTKIVIINVIPVNDAPVNAVPGDQTVKQDAVLTFNTANGNLISVSDVDADGSPLIVTLTATNGLITLATTTSLAFHNGNVPGTATLEFEGSLAQINAALNGMKFTPTPGYNGPASFTIISNDQGATGSGGVLTDTDTFNITVQPLNPGVTNVSIVEGNRAYKVGETVNVAVTFDMSVTVAGGVPTLLLETGLTDRFATYVSGSGTNSLIFSYTVQAGDVSADLDYHSSGALQLNGATLKSAASDDALLTLPTLGGANSIAGQKAIVIDGVVPTISSVTAPPDGTYIVGQNLDFTVNLSENVVVSTAGGTPRIEVTLDTGGTVYADYVSGSGGSALVFRLTVASGQLDSNGVTVGNLQLHGGTLRDSAGNDAVVTLSNTVSTPNVNVDGVAPTVISVTTPPAGSYKAGAVLTFTVNASEALQTGGLPPRLVLDVGGVTGYATYVSGSGSNTLVFQYSVLAGHNDGDGIAVNGIELRGEPLTDLAGNNLNLTLNGLGNTAGVWVDSSAPSASTIVNVDANPNNAASVRFTVTFSEQVAGVDASDFNLVFTGSAGGSISSVTALNGYTYSVVVGDLSGDGSLRLDLNSSGTGIVDRAGNAISGGLSGSSYSIDRVAPSVISVAVPANGTYVAGQNLDFTVHLDEAVQLNTSNGTPRIAVALDNGLTAYASYLAGASSSTALVFRLSVASGQVDSNGITLGSAIQLNGATLRDSIGNDANLVLNAVGNTNLVQIDALVPAVSSIGLPAAGAYRAGDVLRFTVNTSENVFLDANHGTPRIALNMDGQTLYASYVSGSGSRALLFEYSVQAGNNAPGGLSLGASIDLNGASLRDAAGNPMSLALNPQDASAVLIDTTAPQVSDIVNVAISPTNASAIRYTVTFDETVNGVDSADFSLSFTGTSSGRIAAVERINGHTYSVLVDSLSGMGNVRLDLNASGSGIVDAAGNSLSGSLQGSSYSIDRVAPSISSVSLPAAGQYGLGQHLDFTLNTNEPVLVSSNDGTPRLAIRLDNGQVAYANYLSGSGSNALVFRLSLSSGMSANGTLSLEPTLELNGGALRDAQGNDAQLALGQLGSTAGILLDAKAPLPTSIVLEKPATVSDRSMSFVLSFDEAVSGVDVSDFSLITTGNARAVLQAVEQIDSKTYRVLVTNLSGTGNLTLNLNAAGSGIADSLGNALQESLSGPQQSLRDQDVGDLDYRLNPPEGAVAAEHTFAQQNVGFTASSSVSPLAAPGLFEVRTVGGSVQPLGIIFLGNGSSAPSFIAQVFGSSDSGFGSGTSGGFGGGEGGVFGSSTFAGIFSRDVPGVSEMNVFNGSQWQQSDLNQGLRGVFGAPTLGQQLHDFNEQEQRHVRALAWALAQPTEIGKSA